MAEIKSGVKVAFLLVFLYLQFKTNTSLNSFVVTLTYVFSNINDLSPDGSILINNFNARSSKWWPLDKDFPEGHEIESLTSTAGYSQLIDQPEQITNTSSSCIDLIFTTNSCFVKDSGVELSLFDKCHHNIIFGKVNLKIPLPAYTREVWSYEKANVEGIQRSIFGVHWDYLFQGTTVLNKSENLKWNSQKHILQFYSK